MSARFLIAIFTFLIPLCTYASETKVSAVITAEVIAAIKRGEQLPDGGLMIRVKKLWDWRKGDGTVPVPKESQLLVLTHLSDQATAAIGDTFLVRVEHSGVARTKTGQPYRVFKVIERL
jgi:hypothetical protein